MPGRATDPPHIPAALWQQLEMQEALANRDVRRVFHLVRQHAGASQTRIAIACGLAQGKVSEIMSGGRQVVTFDVFERVADGLDMPDHARLLLGLAPQQLRMPAYSNETTLAASWAIPRRDDLTPLAASTVELTGDEEDDSVRRRSFIGLAGAGLFGAVLSDIAPARAVEVESFAAALIDGSAAVSDEPCLDLDALTRLVTTARRDYQACRYSSVLGQLPSLLTSLRTSAEALDGEAQLSVYDLSAEAYHVAAGALLKLDDEGLAWLAADRSLRAARLSGNSLTIGSSGRIITHALMSTGHLGAATSTAENMAARMDSDIDRHNAESLSVYGALLLRGAIAAAKHHNRDAAATLLDEADRAATMLGEGHHIRSNAFGPSNVSVHRVNAAVTLGDAGTAIELARKVDLDRLPVVERKAALLIDCAHAFAQWGKYENAYHALRAAEQLAREEIASRPAVHRLVQDLAATAGPSVRSHLREFAAQIGAGA